MSDEITAIAGTRKAFKEMADGTLRVQIDIEPRNKAEFHALFPDIDMPCAIAPLNLDVAHDGGNLPGKIPTIVHTEGAAAEVVYGRHVSGENNIYGQQARALRLSSFFRTPEVWKAVGTDADLQSWVRQLPCIVCGNHDFDPDTGIGQTVFAHVRRAEGAGTGHKPEYSGVPMCHECHAGCQHQHGETAAYRKFIVLKSGHEQQVTLDQAKDWFNQKRIEMLQDWCWDVLKGQLGYDSWGRVPPIDLFDWALESNVSRLLPECYCGTAVGD